MSNYINQINTISIYYPWLFFNKFPIFITSMVFFLNNTYNIEYNGVGEYWWDLVATSAVQNDSPVFLSAHRFVSLTNSRMFDKRSCATSENVLHRQRIFCIFFRIRSGNNRKR